MSSPVTERTHRTVVGVDGSPESLSALDWAAGLAASTGGVVEAIATWEWPTGLGTAPILPSGFDPAADAATMLDGALDVARRSHPDVGFVARVVEGRAGEVLVEASRGADLLAVGTRGRSEVAGLLVGSVSEHCATHAHSPVLVYRNRA